LISIEHLKSSEFNYELPPDQIAAFPVSRRDQSRLLIRDSLGNLQEDIFRNVAVHIPEGSTIFFNNSKVIPARLIFNSSAGSRIELFCLQPLNPPEYGSSLISRGSCTWECMTGNSKRFKEHALHLNVICDKGNLALTAEKKALKGNKAEITFSWDNESVSFAEILAAAGNVPLPPYIKRKPVPEDRWRYQTIYSKIEGSVAAPTAGLHFTDEVLNSLVKRNIRPHEVTLHVGSGTFQPVKSEFVREHRMHAEYFEITAQTVEELSVLHERVTCVGTTTVRTLESMYWIGAKLALSRDMPEILHLGQWEPYSLNECTPEEAFHALSRWFGLRKDEKALASTSFMIVPGYRFRMTDKLITNFHQPGSSLLMLIAAFIGETWRDTYEYALKKGFRFLSYGDSSLLFNPDVDFR